ncbi:MAG: hypothetical protein H0V44_16695 [Planctomycetes bacterium]|nr:hypothetical protein [Planctomycetota bacterium]
MTVLEWIVHLAAAVACLAAPLPAAWAIAVRCGSRPGAAHLLLAMGCGWMLFAALAVVGCDLTGELSVPRILMIEGVLAFGGVRLLLRDRQRAALACASVRAAIVGVSAWSAPERLMLAALACAGAAALAGMVCTPTGDYDSWMYQLPQVAESIQKGTLEARQEQWLDKQTYERGILYYPGDWSAMFWLTTAPLGRDTLTLLPNLIAWLVLGLATRGLALRSGADRVAALTAAAVVMLMPLCGWNLHSAHVDLALGATLAAMLYFTGEGVAAGGWAERWFALALGGLLVGTKMSGIGMLAAPVLCAAWLWRGRRRAIGSREPLIAVLALGSLAVLGASWYVRNWLFTGNPLGFVAMHVVGIELPGVIDRAYIDQTNLLHAFDPLRAWHWWLLVASLAAFCAPVIACAVGAAPRMVEALRRSRDARALVAVALLLAWLYVAGPWSAKHAHDDDLSWWMGQQLRYTFGLWAVIAALAATAWSGPRAPRLAAVLVAVAAAAFPFCGYGWFITAPVALGCALLCAAVAIRTRMRMRIAWTSAALVGVVLLAAVPLADAWRWRQLDARGGGVSGFLARRLGPDEPVGFWGSHQSWLLYGRDLRRPVQYMEFDDCTDAPMLAWLMRVRGCRWVALGPKWRDFPPERYQLVEDHPDLFTREHGDPAVWGMCVYRLNDP